MSCVDWAGRSVSRHCPLAVWRAPPEAPLAAGLPEGLYDTATLETLPGKRPLIRLTTRPPNYETPQSYFADAVTPNDAFFVRYHLATIPRVNAAAWKLDVGGEGAASPLSLTLNELETGFEQVEIAAVCQCSGNRRGFSNPHVPGVQWGSGAMGNAVWRGPRLKDVLARAQLRTEVVEIVFDGADTAPLTGTPDFVKSIPAAKAQDDNTIIALRMNGEPLPALSRLPGAPRRARMDRDLLDETPGVDPRDHAARRWVLDARRLPHPERPVSGGAAFPVPGDSQRTRPSPRWW